MEIITKTPEKVEFVEELNEGLANAIRRSALEIPILAIDEVEIFKNDSALYDEVLALRLGLIPLKTPKDMNLKEDCSCKGKGCSKCEIQIKIQTSGEKMVYAKEMKGEVEIVYEEMPIVKLIDEQELEVVATARLGKGINHTKYSPGLVYYRNIAEINAKKCENPEKVVNSCPRGVFKIEKGKLEIADKYACDICEACFDACNSIEIVPGNEILFSIESYGQIKAEDILINAVKALKENLKEVEKA